MTIRELYDVTNPNIGMVVVDRAENGDYVDVFQAVRNTYADHCMIPEFLMGAEIREIGYREQDDDTLLELIVNL